MSPLRLAVLPLLLALVPVSAYAKPETPAPVAAQTKPDLEFRFVGSRLYHLLYWRIDSRGRGEVAAPKPLGHAAMPEPGKAFRYVFAPGVHSFDIGPGGYADLRAILSDVLDGKADPGGLMSPGSLTLSSPCRVMDAPSGQLSWNRPSPSSFLIPSTCLSPEGEALATRFDEAWRIIARHMLKRGQAGVGRERIVATLTPPPLTLEYRQQSPWTGFVLHWRIAPDGAGWIDLSEGENLQVADPGPGVKQLTVYLAKGRHRFAVGPAGYARVRAALDPFIAEPQQLATCDGPSDQPMVTLTWRAPRAKPGTARGDLGCRALADKASVAVRTILSAFAEPEKR